MTMRNRVKKATQELSMAEMLALHGELLATSGEEKHVRKLQPAHTDEIRRRIREIDSGKVEGTDAFQALKEM